MTMVEDSSKAIAAFKTLSALASGTGPKPNEEAGMKVPFCARSVTEFRCKLCTKEFASIPGLVSHSRVCHLASPSEEEHLVRSRTCGLCGETFPSEIAKKMHLISQRMKTHCQSCLDPLDSAEETVNHICSEVCNTSNSILGQFENRIY